jgi:hypothetical protein
MVPGTPACPSLLLVKEAEMSLLAPFSFSKFVPPRYSPSN